MTTILLHRPVASTPADGGARPFERVHMFPGRHLGEEEFDREQQYADLRLASLMRGRNAGIVHGLEVNLGPNGVSSDGFTVNAGLALDGFGHAVSLYYPLRVQWDDLVDSAGDPTGVYYIVLERSSRRIDAPSVDPCQRLELDPTRDTALVVTGTLALAKLNVSAGAVTTSPREQIENWVAADRVDGSFLAAIGSAVPLALVAIGPVAGGFGPLWLSQEAGRYEAVRAGGYRVLLNQTSAALRRVMQRAAVEVTDPTLLADFLDDNLHLDFLPAAGELPLEWLRNPAATTPSLLWLPAHLGVDMVPVPEEAVRKLIDDHIARRVIDLRQPAGDAIRLLLAVNEPDYRPDLLDIPETDGQLEQDLFRFHLRAHDAWRNWIVQHGRLYHVDPETLLTPVQIGQLELPQPEPAPPLPGTFVTQMIARADAELDPDAAGLPYPFDEGVPAAPAFYTQWLSDDGSPPPPAAATESGLVVQYATAQADLEAIENQIRAARSRVEKTRDLLLLMRQQLDSQTVALAALAGGVAGDGTGLQVARWLPYANLEAVAIPDTTTTPAAAPPAPAPAAPAANRAFSIAAAPLFSSAALAAALAPQAVSTATVAASSTNLFRAAGASTSTVSKAMLLASKPQTFSAFELGINKSRLDLLSRVTKEAVAKPAFEAKEYRFGVIDHISPEVNEYAKAYFGMKELLATLQDLFDLTDAAGLRSAMKKVGQVDEDTSLGGDDKNPFERSGRLESPAALDTLATRDATVNGVVDAKKRALLATQYRYHALFKAGRILTQWIAICEARYNTLERKLQGKLREQVAKLAQLEKLAGLIRVARETFENLDRIRIEQLGDYGVAQRLLDEDWRQIFARNRERTRILTSALRGLYYVRVRGTPVSAPLADPLSLRFASARDPVPGCDWEEEVDLPSALEPFFQAVCEVPMDGWARLKPLQPKLPPFHKFDYLSQLRQSRFKARPAALPTNVGAPTLQARLQTVLLQNNGLLQQWAALALPAFTVSTRETQSEAAKVLSLEDLSLVSGALRNEAQALKDQLEHAAFCLLEKLNLLPGSVRLQWGQLAEDDQIRVESVSWWPGLDRAEADDFNAARTVAELIGWWFRQLDPGASASSGSAMRNMIRALLIHASLGDPQEIIRGTVYVPPRLPRLGEPLQLKLNRAPVPGTRLQLLDPAQRVVAVLAVEDHTPESTRASIVNLVHSDVTISTRFSVVASKSTRQRL